MKRCFYIILNCIPLLWCRAGQIPETIAMFGDIPIKVETVKNYPLPADREERRKVLKKLADTEIYITIIRQLLERSQISPGEKTALRYVNFRKIQCGGELPDSLKKTLESRIQDSAFQLKSALYFIFYAADPATVEPSMAKISKHYDLNREKFRTPVKGNFGIFRAGNNDDEGRRNAATVLSRLRQGEEFNALALKFDPDGSGKNSASRYRKKFAEAMKGIKNGETTAITTESGIFMVKVISRNTPTQIPLSEAAPVIREFLSGMMLKNSLEQYIREIIAKHPVKYCF